MQGKREKMQTKLGLTYTQRLVLRYQTNRAEKIERERERERGSVCRKEKKRRKRNEGRLWQECLASEEVGGLGLFVVRSTAAIMLACYFILFYFSFCFFRFCSSPFLHTASFFWVFILVRIRICQLSTSSTISSSHHSNKQSTTATPESFGRDKSVVSLLSLVTGLLATHLEL